VLLQNKFGLHRQKNITPNTIMNMRESSLKKSQPFPVKSSIPNITSIIIRVLSPPNERNKSVMVHHSFLVFFIIEYAVLTFMLQEESVFGFI
jgi:hypothetical protein